VGWFGRESGGRRTLIRAYPADLPTFAERLRAAGWRTAMVVSNPLYMTSGLYADGWDLVLDAGVARGEVVNAAARLALELHADSGPLCLMVHYMDVHHWQPWYLPALEGEPARRPTPEEALAAYEESVRATDRHLGALLALWEARAGRPADGADLVAFWSDHGESLLEDGVHLGHGNSLREELLRVPLVLRPPRALGIEPAVVRRPASLVDLHPTLLQALDVAGGAQALDGRSLLAELPEQRVLYADYQLYGDELSCARSAARKLVVDLTHERGELRDIESAGEPVVEDEAARAALTEAFGRYVESSAARSAGLESQMRADAEAVARALDALGYLRAGSE
jgi:hypothetical protein